MTQFTDVLSFSPGVQAAQMPLESIEWRNRSVVVMGLGRHGGGVGAARYLATHGARVTISDIADEDSLRSSLDQLTDLSIDRFQLGWHDERDFREAEFVVVNPAVPQDHNCLQVARAAGARLTSEVELFLARCPANVIGITGTNGKTTTAAMLASILTAAGRCTWLGGNIGGSLLADLGQMRRDDWVVLELSSFQLAHLGATTRWPRIAIVTNCTPNHLDWHHDFDDYAAAKRRLFTGPRTSGINIINLHDPVSRDWASGSDGKTLTCWPLEQVDHLTVPGDHNRQNAACAAAAAEAAGVDRATILETLATFAGFEHRIEPIGEVLGRRFYNDSKSTSPAATIAALDAVPGPSWLLLGGRAKVSDFSALARTVVARAVGVAAYGESRYALCSAMVEEHSDFHVVAVERMADALAWCWRQSRAGDAIVLSPAAASHDQYRDYEARGEAFRALVRALARDASGE